MRASIPWSLRPASSGFVFAWTALSLLLGGVQLSAGVLDSLWIDPWYSAVVVLPAFAIAFAVAWAKDAPQALRRSAIALCGALFVVGLLYRMAPLSALQRALLWGAMAHLGVGPVVITAGFARSSRHTGGRSILLFGTSFFLFGSTLLAGFLGANFGDAENTSVFSMVMYLGIAAAVVSVVGNVIESRRQRGWFRRVYEGKEPGISLRIAEPADAHLPYHAEPEARNTQVLLVHEGDGSTAYREGMHERPMLRVPRTLEEALSPAHGAVRVPGAELFGIFVLLVLAGLSFSTLH